MQKAVKDFMRHPPEKVIQMYRAVIDMINDGVVIRDIKVVDITNRAGIGKGTAYEYFSTKEEIIAKALLYEMLKGMDFMYEVAYNENSFEQKINKLLDYGAAHYHQGRTIFQLMKIMFGSYDMSEELKQQFCEMKEETVCSKFLMLQDVVIQAGVKENIIKNDDKERQRAVVNSQIISFLYCMNNLQNNESAMTLEEIKLFIYDSIVKLLG